MPPTSARPHTVDLLLRGHHYLTFREALAAAGAAVIDETDTVMDQAPAGIAATITVDVLAGAVPIASAMELVFRQHGPHYLVKTAQAAVVAALAVAVIRVISFLAQMLRPRRQNRRQ